MKRHYLLKRKCWVLISWLISCVLFILLLSGSHIPGGEFSFSRTPTPNQPKNTVLDQERTQMIKVGEVFTHPLSRSEITEPINAQELLTNPGQFNGYDISLEGKVQSITSVSNLMDSGWLMAYWIVIDDSTAWLPVLYRGSIKSISIGDTIKVKGAYSASGLGLHADLINRIPKTTEMMKTAPLEMVISIYALFIVGVISIGLFIVRNRKLSVLLLLIFTLASCEFQAQTIIKPDGSVTTSFHVIEKSENVKLLRDIPGTRRYLESWKEEQRANGLLVENLVINDLEHYFLSKKYLNLEAFSQYDEASIYGDSWVYATALNSGNYYCHRFLANINTQSLYQMSPDIDSNYKNQIQGYLNEMIFQYSLVMPGSIVYSNSSSIQNNKVLWNLNMNSPNELVAESCQETSKASIDWRWGWLAIAGGVFIDLGLIRLSRKKRS